MSPARWSRIEELYHLARERPPDQRSAFLAEACGADEELRRAVELLLAQDNLVGPLDQPAIKTEIREKITFPTTQTYPHSPNSGHPPRASKFRDWVRSRSGAFWLFLLGDVLALCFYAFLGTMIARYHTETTAWGFDAEFEAGSWWVDSVDPHGPAAGKLELGDQVLSLNGKPSTATGMLAGMRSVSPGAVYPIRVLRNRTIQAATLRLEIVADPKGADDIAAFGIVSVTFFLTAMTLGLLKPDQAVVQRGYVALMSEALVLAKVLLVPYESFLRGPPDVVLETVSLLDGPHFVFAYLFYCTLFEGVLETRRWKSFLYILCPWAALVVATQMILGSCQEGSTSRLLEWWIPWLDGHPAVMQFFAGYDRYFARYFYIIALLSICAVIMRNYIKVKLPDARRRARWIAFGSLAGIIPYTLVKLSKSFVDIDFYQGLIRLSIVAAIVIPAATGYAIYKHRMFDIRVVVRSGIRYMLAKGSLQAALALPAIGLILALVKNADRTVADAIWYNAWFLILLVLLAGVLKFRLQLKRWLDKRFFRESYGQEQVLLALIDSVQKVDSLSEMAQTVGEELAEALHPESIAILFRTPGDRILTSAYCHGVSGSALRLQEDSLLLEALEGGGEARQVSTAHEVPAEELRSLEMLEIDLMVPMRSAGSGLAGVILLGRKLSEEPYTSEDRRLLTALAGQMSVVYENILLHRILAEQQKSAEELRSRLEADRIDTLRECPLCGRCYDLSVLLCPDDGSQLTFSLAMGRTINRYRLERRIGQGGMGVVYEAEDLSLHRRVAVKVMTGRVRNPTVHQRAYREARAVARLNHPNIISTYDFGVSGDAVYLVMELVSGETLRTSIVRSRSIDPAAAAVWFDQILAGMEAAHRAGIIHRDLKPENIMITIAPEGGPLVKILDFGIARLSVADLHESASITNQGTIVGSVQYMSPEQFSSSKVDARSDIFSIGLMAFEVLTGRLPFSGKTYREYMFSVLDDDFSIPEIAGSAKELESALRKCLAKDPDARFASCAEVRRNLIPLIAQYRSVRTQASNS